MNGPDLPKQPAAAAQHTDDTVSSAAWAILLTLEGLHAGASTALARVLPTGWTMIRFRLEVGKENEAEPLAEAPPVGLGVPIGVNDVNGRPIHIGDTLDFDEREYGCPCRFTIEIKHGSIQHPGSTFR